MTINGGQRECAFPPHPDSGGDGPQLVTDSAARRFADWLRHAPAERVPLPAIPVVWTAAEILHLAAVPGMYPGAATVAAAGLAYGAGEARARDPEAKRLRGAEVAAVTAVTGAWLTAGTIAGPLAGPDHALSIAYGLGAVGGYWWLRRHEALKAARARRDAKAAWLAKKAAWHALAPRLGLQGSHLLSQEDTLLGDTRLIDTRGTGRRASQLAGRDLAERLAEIEMLPVGRITVAPDHRMAGRLRITTRRTDPWAAPIPHPLLVPDSPYAQHFTSPASIRDGVVVGADPETGRPLRAVLWEEGHGGKVVQVTAMKGSGKTVLLSCVTLGVVRCADAILIQVNLSKFREDRHWAPLAAANALGREHTGRARRILRWVLDALEARSRSGDDAVFAPTAETPLIVVKIDEIDVVAADDVCRVLLERIASKCRSECAALIIAGQRATAQWTGGANLRANVDVAVVGRVSRAREAGHALGGDGTESDGITDYGEGKPGVFLIQEKGSGADPDRGRVFNLREITDIERAVRQLAATRRPYVPEPAFAGLAATWAKITGTAPPGDAEDDGEAPAAGAVPDGEDLDDSEAPSAPAYGYGAGGLTAKVAAARAAGADVAGIPPIPPGMEAHAAAQLAERQRQFREAYTDIALPEADQAALRAMLERPGGITVRAAAAALPWGRTKIHQQLVRWRAEGTAEKRGKGAGQRWHAAAPGAVPVTYPPLRALPDMAEGDAP